MRSRGEKPRTIHDSTVIGMVFSCVIVQVNAAACTIIINSDLSFELTNATLENVDLSASFSFFEDQGGKLLWKLDSTGASQTSLCVTSIESDLSFYIPNAAHSNSLESMKLWFKFKYFGEQNSFLLWVLDDYGVIASAPDPPDQIVSIPDSMGMTFVYLAPGTFTMRAPLDELGRYSADHKEHQVSLTKGFYMQATEVTQGQWEAVMGSNPSFYDTCGPNCPVEMVTWDEIQEFISKLNQSGEYTYMLPTEAQWEYAARAGSNTAFANGVIVETGPDYDPNLDAIGWYFYNSDGKTHPVAQKIPNAWGLYDMHGNVVERCQDWYDPYFGSADFVTDPAGPSTGKTRVVRGGSWAVHAASCRSAARGSYYPGDTLATIGFRLLFYPNP